jgi:hypothetical protein
MVVSSALAEASTLDEEGSYGCAVRTATRAERRDDGDDSAEPVEQA